MNKSQATIPSKKLFGMTLDKSIMKEFQRLALDVDRFTNDLMEEAMKDLMEKYKNLTDSTRRGRHE